MTETNASTILTIDDETNARAFVSSSTILTIDDETNARAFIRAVLSPEGVRVLDAENGPQGIQIAKAERPDLILLDVAMPGMDRWEVARALRSEPRTRVLLTGWCMTQSGRTIPQQ